MDTASQQPISEAEFNDLAFDQAISKTGKAYWKHPRCDGFLGWVEQGAPSYRTYCSSFYRNLTKRAHPDSGFSEQQDYKRATVPATQPTAATHPLDRAVCQSELQALLVGQADLVGRLEAQTRAIVELTQLVKETRDSVDALAIPQ